MAVRGNVNVVAYVKLLVVRGVNFWRFFGVYFWRFVRYINSYAWDKPGALCVLH
jgi:hypothetical protein